MSEPRPQVRSLLDLFARTSRGRANNDSRFARAALETDRREGASLGLRGRLLGLLAAAVLLGFSVPIPGLFWYWGLLSLIALSGWAQHAAALSGRTRIYYALLFLDGALFVIIALAPNPLFETDWPTAAAYKFGAYKYVFVFLVALSLGGSWRLVVGFGAWMATLWLTAAGLIATFGTTIESVTVALVDAVPDLRLRETLDPNRIDWTARIEEAVVIVLVASMLAVNGFRARRKLYAEAEAARERANLARHFAPTMVNLLADQDSPLEEVREAEVAVIFIDIVGFTSFAERSGPALTVKTLRYFHGEIERIVFDHAGTLDKFLGDGAMITFGTPISADDDAARALACIRALAGISLAQTGLKVAIGGHLGPVVLGDIGSARRLEYATIGDTVNVASRLEEATRAVGVHVLVSDALVAKAGCSEGLMVREPMTLRGRQETLAVWTVA